MKSLYIYIYIYEKRKNKSDRIVQDTQRKSDMDCTEERPDLGGIGCRAQIEHSNEGYSDGDSTRLDYCTIEK